jgi:Flp pilus assembly protein TadD
VLLKTSALKRRPHFIKEKIMKKRRIQAVFTAMAVITALTSCAGTPAQTDTGDGLSLNVGIAQIARELENELPAGTRIAVVNLESPSARFSDFVLEELQGYLISGKKLVVTERAKLELLRNEITFQMSGEVSDESAVSLGKFLGAQTLITGSMTDMGGAYRCRFNAIDIETAVRTVSPAVTLRNDRTIAYMLPASATPPPAQVPAKPDPSLATAYFNTGFAHYEAKRYTEAVADFTRALAVTQDDEASLRYRALSYYYLKDYDGTIADMSRLIAMNPGNAENYLTRSAAYNEKGEYDKGIADCNEALRLNSNYAEAYNNRGAAYNGKREYDRAIADYNQALRLNSNYAETYSGRGLAYGSKKEYDRAIADYNQALRLNSNYAEAYTNRGSPTSAKGSMTEPSPTTLRHCGSTPIMLGCILTGASPTQIKGSMTEPSRTTRRRCGSTPIMLGCTLTGASPTQIKGSMTEPSRTTLRRCGSTPIMLRRTITGAMLTL